MKNIFWALIACMFFSHSLFALEIMSAGADFKTAVDGWENLPHTQKIEKWELFENKYQSIYDQYIYIKNDPDWKTKQAKTRRDYFMNFAKIKNQTIELFENSEELIKKIIQDFKVNHPNFDDNISIIILPTLFKFSALSLPGSANYPATILIGVDSIIYKGQNLQLVLEAELVHLAD